jgi:hypothetical protein
MGRVYAFCKQLRNNSWIQQLFVYDIAQNLVGYCRIIHKYTTETKYVFYNKAYSLNSSVYLCMCVYIYDMVSTIWFELE